MKRRSEVNNTNRETGLNQETLQNTWVLKSSGGNPRSEIFGACSSRESGSGNLPVDRGFAYA